MFTYFVDCCFFLFCFLILNYSDVKQIMAPHEFVEIRLVCKADYLDPQLKLKLHDIKDKLREILHTGNKEFNTKEIKKMNTNLFFLLNRSKKICIKKSAAVE